MTKTWRRIGKVLAGMLIFGWLLFASQITAKAETTMYTDGTFFDAAFYAATYPDVAAAVGTDEYALLNHYLTAGMAEGRLPYANYAAGLSPITGIPEIPLATSNKINFDPNDPVLTNYLYQAAQIGWDHYSEKFGENYRDAIAHWFYGVNSHSDFLTIGMEERMVDYFPWADRSKVIPGDGFDGYIDASALQNFPEFYYNWTVYHEENNDTWCVNVQVGDWIDETQRFNSYRDLVSWEILRNVLRYITPDAEAVFRNAVSMHYRRYCPDLKDAGNFYNLGTTICMYADAEWPETIFFRDNSRGLDMNALHNVIPSQQSGEVPLTTVKRTSFDPNDPYLLAYKAAYDPWSLFTKAGTDVFDPDDVSRYDLAEVGTLYYFDNVVTSWQPYHHRITDIWGMQYNEDNNFKQSVNAWTLSTPGYLYPQEYDALRQFLRYVSPDAEAIYAKILQNETYGNVQRNKWIKVGSSKLYVMDPDNEYYGYLYFFK